MKETNKNEVILPYDGYFEEVSLGKDYSWNEIKKDIFIRPFWNWRTFYGISGRIGKREFGLYMLPLFVLMFGIIAIVLTSNSMRREIVLPQGIISIFSMLISLCMIIWFSMLIPMVARRLHDLNKSSWLIIFIILTSLVPGLNLIIALLLIFTWGTTGDNSYWPQTMYKVKINKSKLEEYRKKRLKKKNENHLNY